MPVVTSAHVIVVLRVGRGAAEHAAEHTDERVPKTDEQNSAPIGA